MLVMLNPGRKAGVFRRSIFGSKGERVETLEFHRGQPVEVTKKAELEAIKDDLGVSLIEVELNERKKPKPKSESKRKSRSKKPSQKKDDPTSGQKPASDSEGRPSTANADEGSEAGDKGKN